MARAGTAKSQSINNRYGEGGEMWLGGGGAASGTAPDVWRGGREGGGARAWGQFVTMLSGLVQAGRLEPGRPTKEAWGSAHYMPTPYIHRYCQPAWPRRAERTGGGRALSVSLPPRQPSARGWRSVSGGRHLRVQPSIIHHRPGASSTLAAQQHPSISVVGSPCSSAQRSH